MKEHLEKYFSLSKGVLRNAVDENLYLLCIMCFEVGQTLYIWLNVTVILCSLGLILAASLHAEGPITKFI